LALLSQGLLTGKDLTAFVKRSVELIWWPLGFPKPRRSLFTFEVSKTPKVFNLPKLHSIPYNL
jgi:hypothetical protein